MTVGLWIQIILNGVAMGVLYSLPALGISLIWNATGLFNFAQGDLLTLGGYVMLTLFGMMKLPYIVSFVLTLAVMGLVGYSSAASTSTTCWSTGSSPDHFDWHCSGLCFYP